MDPTEVSATKLTLMDYYFLFKTCVRTLFEGMVLMKQSLMKFYITREKLHLCPNENLSQHIKKTINRLVKGNDVNRKLARLHYLSREL